MDKLQGMQLFTRVVESGSFTAGAAQMGISRALASKLIQNLEDSLGVRLLNRTTRRISLTDPGKNYYQRVSDLLAQLAEAEAEAAELQVEPRGRMRVSAPISFSVLHLASALSEFQRRFPRVELELDLDDRQVDLVEEGYDLAIRIGRLADSSLVARRIAPACLALVASPGYLQRAGTPRHPDELAGHEFLMYTLSTRRDELVLERDGEKVAVKIHGNLMVNNGDYIAASTLEGNGISLLPTFIVASHLRSGALVSILGGWNVPPIAIHAVYAQTRSLPAKTRVLIDFLIERFGPEPHWEQLCSGEASGKPGPARHPG
ncbi:MAG TPA: LysR family transcriptional regulator [Dokdonella sp.]|jgi:DNA-binding transcriptional LysR family regulator|nr:LysR family transcriptional regulator [Dokdonella sp.]